MTSRPHPGDTVANVNVCVVQIDGIDEQSCANLDLDALRQAVSDKYSLHYRRLDNPIVIINPSKTDTIEINGQVIKNPTPSIDYIGDEFDGSAQVDGQDEYASGTISASGDPAVAGFAGTEQGSVSGYYEDSTTHRVDYGWRSGPVGIQMGVTFDLRTTFRSVQLGYDNNEVVQATQHYGRSGEDTIASSFNDNLDLTRLSISAIGTPTWTVPSP